MFRDPRNIFQIKKSPGVKAEWGRNFCGLDYLYVSKFYNMDNINTVLYM